MLKISFCTTCKGRLEHLKQTLPQNLADNADYPNIEFVILDYNSRDGLGDWIQKNYADEIESGRIRYVHYPEPEHFQLAHAKNMAHRMATGDVLVNLDADNYTGLGYAHWANERFTANQDIIIRPGLNHHHTSGSGPVRGRIAIHRDHFMKLHGYDERITSWGQHGGDDNNLTDRAKASGLRWVDPAPDHIGDFIQHDDEMRVMHASQEDREISTDIIEQHQSIRSLPGRAFKRLIPKPQANPDGNFGCGTVYVNFSEEPTVIAPMDTMRAVDRLQHRQCAGDSTSFNAGR